MNHAETNLDFAPIHTTPGIALGDRLDRFASAHPLKFGAWLTVASLTVGGLIGALCAFVAWLPVVRS